MSPELTSTVNRLCGFRVSMLATKSLASMLTSFQYFSGNRSLYREPIF